MKTINQIASLLDNLINVKEELKYSSTILGLNNTIIKIEYDHENDEITVWYAEEITYGLNNPWVEVMNIVNVSDRNRRYLAQMIMSVDY